MVKKIGTWGLIAFLVFYVVTQPTQAAGILKALGMGVKGIATGFGNFISQLT
jgi:hypothetical protein